MLLPAHAVTLQYNQIGRLLKAWRIEDVHLQSSWGSGTNLLLSWDTILYEILQVLMDVLSSFLLYCFSFDILFPKACFWVNLCMHQFRLGGKPMSIFSCTRSCKVICSRYCKNQITEREQLRTSSEHGVYYRISYMWICGIELQHWAQQGLIFLSAWCYRSACTRE